MYEWDAGRRNCRLRCDVCGDYRGAWRAGPTAAVTDGIGDGWEIVFDFHCCPDCNEKGRMAGTEWLGDVRVRVAD